MKYEKIYQKLKKEYTDEEIVDSMLLPADLTKSEKEQLHQEMKAIRLQRLANMTEQDIIVADVMRLGFEIENYIEKESNQKGK